MLYTNNMLYFIGGPAKVGKSKLAERLLQDRKIPFLPTDIIMVLLKENGIDNFNTNNPADLFFKYLEPISKHLPYLRSDFCIEGNGFEPRHLKKLEKKGLVDFKACFMGMSEVDLESILRHAGPETWLLTEVSEEERQKYPAFLVEQSKKVEEQCKEFNFPYIDLAHDYEKQFNEAFRLLTD